MAMRSSDMEVSEAMADANQDDDIEPLSGQPFFHVMLTKSQVGAKRVYQMTLPVHFTRILPNKTVPVTLTCSGKSWETIYLGNGSRFNKFGPSGWKTFVVDNMLKVGDFCVFELMENSDIALNFKVRILRGNFPSVLENKEAGTIENPIVLE